MFSLTLEGLATELGGEYGPSTGFFASGEIMQSAPITARGSFAAYANAGNITLNDPDNAFSGEVILVAVGDIALASSASLHIDRVAGNNVSLSNNDFILLAGNVSAGANLLLNGRVSILQSAGFINVAGESTIGNATSNIHLTLAGNVFGGTVHLSGGNTSLTSQSDLSLDLWVASGSFLTLGAMDLSGSAFRLDASASGSVSQSAALAVSTAALTSTNGDIVLDNMLNDFSGTVALASAGSVSVRDVNDLVITSLYSGANSAVTLYAGGTLTLGTAINTGTADLTLTSNGSSPMLASAGLSGNNIILTGTDIHLAGPVNAAHSLSLSATGAVVLTDTATVGSLDVLHGTLKAGGSARIIGDVNVASGATLAPGYSIGTLLVTGNVALANGALFEVEAAPDGSSDRLVATGDVSLNGAILSLLAANGSWAPATRYTLIEANSVTGTFAAPVISNLAFLNASLDYSAGNSVVLTLTRNDVRLPSVAVTRNQRASAAAVERLNAAHPLSLAVSGLSAQAARAAFDGLSGELHASLQTALLNESRYLREGINRRLVAAAEHGQNTGVLNPGAEGPTFWLQGYSGWAHNGGDGNAASLDHDSTGTLLGADIAVNDTWRVGAAIGMGRTDADQNQRNAHADIDSQSLALYASGRWYPLELRAGLGRTWHDIDSRRNVTVATLNEREKASYSATTTQVFSELSYHLPVEAVQLSPFVGLAHVELASDSFNEHGGAAALHGSAQTQAMSYTSLGLRAGVPLAHLAGLPLGATGSVAWQHAYGSDTPDSRLALSGGSGFSVQGVPLERDSLLADLAIQTQLASNTSLALLWSSRLGDDYRDNSARLVLDIGF